ncbi:class I SAM-dependent methyltransferase [Flavobacterium johnsoniae]|uniref:Methyltransferase type 11 n=1 Tax=Flavobacterium johnsoniae (strain ATCC 17061 / DSM 2064 / JCM 8514 / BCRC 14874 / CCUG 350202 / NBRC 14942 / NCIMB 11054 / UW101) TaxID=376686 RepID=A5FL84_FLAJ1|nr:class I SAM-dependent methyltransferase [Flavobacterium johnsoniae]ABQ04034.1 Methyltransferase type 11 [Flavobacterium johnsoniae UW101]OXE95425.1 methyltransferase [Flavobacterium johnsoniae UW101]WQG79095.1 class I SAM-dependent methyltransferase [Flavobacterium johnsoniae UW101]SHK10449.1 Methyltransferase domain-containing protein [Flavobacterium johnsoniae]
MDVLNKKHFLTVKDHSVSKEIFDLYYDENLDMLITSPQPDLENLGRYYESEDYISHTDNKRSFFEKAYHFVKSIALKNKLNLINSEQSQKGKILDIGAGTGDFLLTAKNDGWNVIGIEPSDRAKNIAKQKGISFAEETASLENNSFDVITMWHVLEHVPNLELQIQELKRLLKPTGTLIVAVPNFKSFDAKHYGEFWAAFDVPIHFWHFSKKAIKSLFEKVDMKLEKVLPMKFDSFYVSLLSEKYKTGKMNFVRAFFIGLRSNLKASSTKEYSSHIYVLKNS